MCTNLDTLLIHHSSVTEALAKLDQIFKRAETGNNATGLTLTGESGSGKTSVLEEFAKKHQPFRVKEGQKIPVLTVTIPAEPTLRALASALLDALGADQGLARETEPTKTRRLSILLKNLDVRIIILEEFQHFAQKKDDRLKIAADWLKVLMDQTKVTVVLSGLPETERILATNEQLLRRFSSRLAMKRFDWNDPKSQTEFRSILQSFHKHVTEVSLPDISASDLAFRFYLATGGLICYIKKILQEAMWNAADAKRKEVTLDDLAIAWMQSVTLPLSKHPQNFNPFTDSTMTLDKAEKVKLVANAKNIGVSHV